jgi:branched-chain amino acid transport system permease protein
MTTWNALLKNRQLPVVLLALIAVVLPLFLKNEYLLHLVILILLWTALGASWNLLGGYTGQVSFGHSAFFGTGAYVSLILHLKLGVSLWMGLLYAGIAASIIAIPIGAICFRLRGPYFSLSILAFSEVLRLIVLHWKEVTQGAVGILLITTIVESKVSFYYLLLIVTVIILFSVGYIVKRKWGFYFVAIRDDEEAAEALGIHTTRYKLYALIVSAFFTGVLGSLFANYTSYIDPYIVFHIGDVAIAMVLIVILGGIGTYWGPLVGAICVVLINEAFRLAFANASVLIYGAMIILVILFLPKGIVGSLKQYTGKWFHA